MTRQFERPAGMSDEDWSSLQWDAALLDAEGGDPTDLVQLIGALVPQTFRLKLASTLGRIPARKNGPAVRARDAIAILRDADEERRKFPKRPNFKALKLKWSRELHVTFAVLDDVIQSRKTYAPLRKYRALYAKLHAVQADAALHASATVSRLRRRKRPPAPTKTQ